MLPGKWDSQLGHLSGDVGSVGHSSPKIPVKPRSFLHTGEGEIVLCTDCLYADAFWKKKEYRRVPEAFIPDENYRCWPSYHHKGCLLSVFDVNEAMEICDSYSQCKAFVLTNQTTWTGRQLVFFKAASNHIMPDPDKITYVKVTD